MTPTTPQEVTERWCYHCQCFHRGAKPSPRTCARKARERGDGHFMHHMLDYN